MKKENIGFWTLYIISAVTLIIGIFIKNSTFIYEAVLIAITLVILQLIRKKMDFKVSIFCWNILLIFIFLSMYAGNVLRFYFIIPYWDKWLHLASGIILALIGKEVYNGVTTDNSNVFISVFFAFLFSVACAGVWEIFEFTADNLIGTNNQFGSLTDTMLDIICGTVGGFIYCLITSFKKQKNKFGVI